MLSVQNQKFRSQIRAPRVSGRLAFCHTKQPLWKSRPRVPQDNANSHIYSHSNLEEDKTAFIVSAAHPGQDQDIYQSGKKYLKCLLLSPLPCFLLYSCVRPLQLKAAMCILPSTASRLGTCVTPSSQEGLAKHPNGQQEMSHYSKAYFGRNFKPHSLLPMV